MVIEWLFLGVSWGCLWFVIVVFPDHTHLLFLSVVFVYNGPFCFSGAEPFESIFSSSVESTVFSGESVCVRISASLRVSV